jgi:putative transcriptional regulator
MKKISDLRKMKSLTQKQLAKDLDISESSIAMYESGKRIPSLIRARRIAEYFEVPVESIDFFCLDSSRNESNSAHEKREVS